MTEAAVLWQGEIHPAASVFPMLPDGEMAALAEDIRQRGLNQAVTLWRGVLLDGRNRVDACKIAGVELRFEDYPGDDPIGFIIAANLLRRHLTTSQASMAAAELANLGVGRPERTTMPDVPPINETNVPFMPMSQQDAASLFGISKKSVARAVRVKDERPDLAEKVTAGDMTVYAAWNELPKAKGRSPGPKADLPVKVLSPADASILAGILGQLSGIAITITERDFRTISVTKAQISQLTDGIRALGRLRKTLTKENTT